jgi:hypothetical protein
VDHLPEIIQVVQLAAYLIGAAIFVAMLKADIRILRHDVRNLSIRQDALNDAFSQLTNVLTQVAVQDARIKAIEDDVRELRHGDGFIVKRTA